MKAARFANVVLAVVAIASAAALAFVVLRIGVHSPRDRWLCAISGMGVVGALAAFWLAPARRVNLAVGIASLAFTLYALEGMLHLFLPSLDPERRAAAALGREYDGRSFAEVIRTLEKRGVRATENVVPAGLVAGSERLPRGESGRSGLFPLGGISRSTVVFCNESGSYEMYRSDEHGFHNPPGVWNRDSIAIAAVGDSFTQGYCVPSDQNAVALLRERWPGTLNLGMSANGPLLTLATLREYLPVIRPRVVLWMYFEGNDLGDLQREKTSEYLLQYVDTAFRQGLLGRQPEIDSALTERIRDHASATELVTSRIAKARRFLTLHHVRAMAGLTRNPVNEQETPYDPLLGELLAQAKTTVEEWGGRLYLVYLPGWERYHGVKEYNGRTTREPVLQAARRAGVDVVDLHPAFAAHPDPSQLFARQEIMPAHYGPAGYRLVADSVARTLVRDGL